MTKSIEEKAEGYATGVVAEWPDKYMPSMSQGNLDLIVVKAFIAGAKSRDEELTRLEGLVREATTVIEGFQLGHEHSAGLNHIRKMGDTYGWCDFCGERVSFGPGEAEQFLAKLRGEAAEGDGK